MKRKSAIVLLTGFLAVSFNQGFGQTNLQFTSVNATDEGAIQLHWTSQSNHLYQIDEADALNNTNGGGVTWNTLYVDYPSQGTNTFIGDFGNYSLIPVIPNPKNSPMRFYRVMDEGQDSLASDEPTVSIVSPTNGNVAAGELTITVVAATDQPVISGTELYVDGQKMQPADGTTNYTVDSTNYETDVYHINTCEWGNGGHTLFATATCASGLEGIHNVSSVSTGHAVSDFVPVSFSNLVTRISFSQYFFDPSAGQTQQVSAIFAANSDWTLNITDASSNVVQTASGSGTSMTYDWDGTGTGGTSLPNGIYYYYISAQTNGLTPQTSSGASGLSSTATATPATELWAMPKGGFGSAVPFIIYPPGFDTNDLTIFEAPVTWNEDESLSTDSTNSTTESASTLEPAFAGPSPQTAPLAPQRPPNNPVKGITGTFAIGYQTYSGNGTNGYSLLGPDNGLHIGQHIAMETFSATTYLKYPPIKPYKVEADNFAAAMRRGDWKQSFVKADDQLKITDLEGSGTPFNSPDLAVLELHGTYGASIDYAANGCMQMYFLIASGSSAQYLRMSQMNFGGSGTTNKLKWIALVSCFSLQQSDWQSMQNAGIKPYNSNLHLILGCGTKEYSSDRLLQYWANYMNFSSNPFANPPPPVMTVQNAWYQAARDAYHGLSFPQSITFSAAGDSACQNDYLTSYNSPSGYPFYNSQQVWP